MNEEEIYNNTQEFGRTQFVREICKLLQENEELKEKINKSKDFLKDEKDKYYVPGGDVLIVSIIDYDYLINILEGDK